MTSGGWLAWAGIFHIARAHHSGEQYDRGNDQKYACICHRRLIFVWTDPHDEGEAPLLWE